MKVRINEDNTCVEIGTTIRCRQTDIKVLGMAALLRTFEDNVSERLTDERFAKMSI